MTKQAGFLEKTLAELEEEISGLSLLLYSSYRIGSRIHRGYAKYQTLREVLLQNGIFQFEPVIKRLECCLQEQLEYGLEPIKIKSLSEYSWLDVRSRQAFLTIQFPASIFFSQEALTRLDRDRPVIVFCQDGSMAPAACRYLRKEGFLAYFLIGGLNRWKSHLGLTIPGQNLRATELLEGPFVLSYPQVLRWGGRTIPNFPQGSKATWIQDVEIYQGSNYIDFRSSNTINWVDFCAQLSTSFDVKELTAKEVVEPLSVSKVQSYLDEFMNPSLAAHGGSVAALRVSNNDLELCLSGGCQGCSSSQLLMESKIPTALYRDFVGIARVLDQTEPGGHQATYRGSESPPDF